MAPAEDADITPFGMSCAGAAPPLALQPDRGCPGPSVRQARRWHPAGHHLAGRAVAAADAGSVQLTRQVL